MKYADLNQNRTTNYTFSYDRMLDMKASLPMSAVCGLFSVRFFVTLPPVRDLVSAAW